MTNLGSRGQLERPINGSEASTHQGPNTPLPLRIFTRSWNKWL